MTVFKAFLGILKSNKIIVVLYTLILIFMAGFALNNMKTASDFVASKPAVIVINHDKGSQISEGFIKYIGKKCELKNISDKEKIGDALFSREVQYVVEIPNGYGKAIASGGDIGFTKMSAGEAGSGFAEMVVKRYIRAAKLGAADGRSESRIRAYTEQILVDDVKVHMTGDHGQNSAERIALYFNFASYSILAACVYVMCMIMAGFNQRNIRRRISVSSMPVEKHNRQLVASNATFATMFWLLYVIIGAIMLKDDIFNLRGILSILNALVFTIVALSIGFLISSFVTDKNAISGIVNVIALGSSFLCGVFIPAEFLPDSVLKVAHIIPTYWYVNTNDRMMEVEKFTSDAIKPIIVNTLVLLGFAVLFLLISNIAAKRRMSTSE